MKGRNSVRRRLLVPIVAVAAAISVVVFGTASQGQVVKRLGDPPQSVVYSNGTWVATFTDDARAVALAGPQRTFSEATSDVAVVSATWVRLLPTPFDGRIDQAWLDSALKDSSPDVLATAMEYVRGARQLVDATGMQIAGDADYGPPGKDGTRAEGSDFNDYLGIPWRYPNGTIEQPNPKRRFDVDCSGFVRLVLGYRLGLPLGLDPDGAASLPRQSFQQAAAAPGIVLIANSGKRPVTLDPLQPGDLVFFDADPGDGPQIDHVGIYLGVDTDGHARFISSRKTANGPTLGDVGGRATLDGDGMYALAFREARRP